jgi:IS30 family transposase
MTRGKKHMTDSDRLQIEHMLREGNSLKKIALKLGKSVSTISREVRKRAIPSEKSAPHRIRNRCLNRHNCEKMALCMDKPNCTRRCSTCAKCNSQCPEFKEEICARLSVAPYVCNGCHDESTCTLRKNYYIHAKAHTTYRQTLTQTRSGANITEGELLALDALVSPLIRKGQSVHHIAANNRDNLNVCEKTLYRYVDGRLLSAMNIDMPRVCRLKPRRTKPVEHKVDTACRIGRTYADFQEFIISSNGMHIVEVDSVIGRVGGKVLLTMMFQSCDLMLAFIRDRNTSQSVINICSALYDTLGPACFRLLFPALLADNGSEFSNPKALEFDSTGTRRTRVFYCNPNSSFQKPHVEVNHEFIRRVLPKGYSFDNLEQKDINLMMSHINSYSREKLNDKTPFDLFAYLYGANVLKKLGLWRIPANEIVLRPSLLKE